jgi:hypothetical protein
VEDCLSLPLPSLNRSLPHDPDPALSSNYLLACPWVRNATEIARVGEIRSKLFKGLLPWRHGLVQEPWGQLSMIQEADRREVRKPSWCCKVHSLRVSQGLITLQRFIHYVNFLMGYFAAESGETEKQYPFSSVGACWSES